MNSKDKKKYIIGYYKKKHFKNQILKEELTLNYTKNAKYQMCSKELPNLINY